MTHLLEPFQVYIRFRQHHTEELLLRYPRASAQSIAINPSLLTA